METMIDLIDVTKSYGKGLPAVNHGNLHVDKGEFVFVVGSSGSGKSTLIKLLMKELDSTSGQMIVSGERLEKMKHRRVAKYRRKLGVVFQDFRLLKDRNVYENVAFAQRVIGRPTRVIRRRVPEVLQEVGLAEKYKSFPDELSGGEQQRVALARALVNRPDILLADEPTTALDVTIQAQVLDMMDDLKKKYNTAMILITHDLGVVGRMCDNVAVIYAGEVLEYGSKEEIFLHPQHPYTIGLFGAIPDLSVDTRRLANIEGLPPDPTDLPTGCCFNPRCPHATDKCRTIKFPLTEVRPGHFCSCPYCEAAEKED